MSIRPEMYAPVHVPVHVPVHDCRVAFDMTRELGGAGGI